MYLAYRDIEAVTSFKDEERAHFSDLYHRDFRTIDELQAFDITSKLGTVYGFDEAYMLGKLKSKPIAPQENNYFMDHAYFSSARLCREIIKTVAKTRGIESITAVYVTCQEQV